ncbi:putative quinol monooxygenase [Companilactobacillus jidongensis]|uniref:putative quinol monooxygenase n=1 Tax=Companilactobacillus jidongensis TaxID=2486006 RepID=UPI000F772E34|nr:antibiotic biosynthesis monooxygenase [Companilactobacillus jidongensis]
MAKLTSIPLFRLFKLRIKADKRSVFVKVGQQNLLTSIKKEPGTLAMYTSHLDNDGVDNRVLELYRDQDSYQTHANSEQFRAFRSVAGQAVIEQSVIPLMPILLVEQGPSLHEVIPNAIHINLTEVDVDMSKITEYLTLLKNEVKHSKLSDTGLFVTYVGQVNDESNKIVLFEVYKNTTSYAEHCQSIHFQKFNQDIQGMVKTQDSIKLRPDVLVNQGHISFEK